LWGQMLYYPKKESRYDLLGRKEGEEPLRETSTKFRPMTGGGEERKILTHEEGREGIGRPVYLGRLSRWLHDRGRERKEIVLLLERKGGKRGWMMVRSGVFSPSKKEKGGEKKKSPSVYYTGKVR